MESGHAEDVEEQAANAASRLRQEFGVEGFDIGIVLGSGWTAASRYLTRMIGSIPSHDVPGFSKPAVLGHSGTISAFELASGKNVLVVGARTHLYEGRGVRAVAHSVRTIAAAGASTLVLTNGAGSVLPNWLPGTPVLISDHINLTFTSPLEGAQFVDTSNLYSSRLRNIAKSLNPNLEEGVYVQFRGPQYETPAEVAMARCLGGQLVGMSTAIEAIAARAAGLEILGMSLVTNLAAGISSEPLSHEEVIATGQKAESKIGEMLAEIVLAL